MNKDFKYRLIIIGMIMMMAVSNIYAQRNVNVDLFHGQMNVSIPIYTVKSKYLSVPVTLDYTPFNILEQGLIFNKGWEGFGWGPYSFAGGIPVSMTYNPGWLGMGWSLNAGGSITRAVNVLPDERLGNTSLNIPKGNLYAPKDHFYNLVPKGFTYVDGVQTTLYDTVYVTHPKDDTFEVGEDEFTFNFCGHSGTFIFYQGEWKVFSDEDIIVGIETDTDSQTGEVYIKKITLETTDGIIYTFGGASPVGGAAPIEFTSQYGLGYDTRTATAWFLSQIESPEGDRIVFQYDSGNDYFIPITSQCKFSSLKDYLNTGTSQWVYGSDYSQVCSIPSDDQIKNLSAGNSISSVYLKSISSSTYPSGISFNRQPYNGLKYPKEIGFTKQKLDNISISVSSTAKTYQFSYIDNSNEIFKLSSLQESGGSGSDATVLPAYQFNYIASTDQTAPELLNKITYPTGGYTGFEYEENSQYKKIRIKKQTSKGADADKSLITNYYYTLEFPTESNLHESGVAAWATSSPSTGVTPQYFLDGYQTKFEMKKEIDYNSPSPDEFSWSFLKKPEVGYSMVWEVQSKENDEGTVVPIGYTLYGFINYKTGYSNNPTSLAGKIEAKVEFNANQDAISSCSYGYEQKPEKENSLIRFFTKSFKYLYNSQIYNYNSDYYPYFTSNPRYNLIRKEDYKNGSSVITTYKYNYSADHLVEQNVLESKYNYDPAVTDGNYLQTTTTTTYKYIDEFNMPTDDGSVVSYINYLPHCQKNIPVETVVKKDGKIIGGSFTKFKTLPLVEDRSVFYRPYQVYNLDISTPIAESTFTAAKKDWTMDARYKLKTTFDSYDDLGSVLEYHNAGGSPMSYYYDTTFKYPLLELKNCHYQDLLNTNSVDDPMKLRTLLPLSQITSYTYSPFVGITSITGPNGVCVNKEFDSLGRLKYIKDNNGKILKAIEYNNNIQ